MKNCLICNAEFDPSVGTSQNFCPQHCFPTKKAPAPTAQAIGCLVLLTLVSFTIFEVVKHISFEPEVRTPAQQRADLEAVVKTTLRAEVQNSFKDPDSVKFEDLVVYPMGKNWALCGEVNGRNSFGAYTGYHQFVAFKVSDAQTAVYVDGETDELSVPEMYAKVCHN
jgi:hypothetical protein